MFGPVPSGFLEGVCVVVFDVHAENLSAVRCLVEMPAMCPCLVRSSRRGSLGVALVWRFSCGSSQDTGNSSGSLLSSGSRGGKL